MSRLRNFYPLVAVLALSCATEPATDSTAPVVPDAPESQDGRQGVEADSVRLLVTGRMSVDGRVLALEQSASALSLNAYAGASAPELLPHLIGVLRAGGMEVSLRVAVPPGTSKLQGLSSALGRDGRMTHAILEQDGRSFESQGGTVTITRMGVLGVEIRIEGGRFTELGGTESRKVDATFRTPLRVQCFAAQDVPGMVSEDRSPTWVSGASDHPLCQEMARLL
jgi:hypothetical protein